VIAIGRSNWLFVGSLRAGKRATAVMGLIHSVRMNGHDPYDYLRDGGAVHATKPVRLPMEGLVAREVQSLSQRLEDGAHALARGQPLDDEASACPLNPGRSA